MTIAPIPKPPAATAATPPKFDLGSDLPYVAKHGVLPSSTEMLRAEAALDHPLRLPLQRLFRAIERVYLMGPEPVVIEGLSDVYRTTIRTIARSAR